MNKFDELLIQYLHGEISEADKAIFEKELETNTELQNELEELQNVDAFLEESLSVEFEETLSPQSHAKILEAARGKTEKSHSLWFYISRVAVVTAACYAVVFAWFLPEDRTALSLSTKGKEDKAVEYNLELRDVAVSEWDERETLEEVEEITLMEDMPAVEVTVQKRKGSSTLPPEPPPIANGLPATVEDEEFASSTKGIRRVKKRTMSATPKPKALSKKDVDSDQAAEYYVNSIKAKNVDPAKANRDAKEKNHFEEAKLHYRNGRLEESKKSLQNTLKLNPYNRQAAQQLKQVEKGIIKLGKEARKKAVTSFKNQVEWSWGAPLSDVNEELDGNVDVGTPIDLTSGVSRLNKFKTEAYDHFVENDFINVSDEALSTFSIDVDTASYSNVRRFLNRGQLPPKGSVRIEELINYFKYDYDTPKGEDPFAVNLAVSKCPWNDKAKLVRIGLKGQEIERSERPKANLVFLLDVSGSMSSQNKLPLLKKSMKLLLNNLNEQDKVAIVVYAGASGLVLPSTACSERGTIEAALERLNAGGSTNGGAGIDLAYRTAVGNFIEDGINRVILCTDGDFNVGNTSHSGLIEQIQKNAKTGVFLSVLGFGMGNYKDSTLERLANKGNGIYGYIDNYDEAKKLFVDQLNGSLLTIAKDVKIQVEFNPQQVGSYRLVGYENRKLNKQDFNDDQKDAGEIGSGHTVTALYELIPTGVEASSKVDELKYQPKAQEFDKFIGEIMNVKVRYKKPDEDKSKLLQFPLKGDLKAVDKVNEEMKLATSVATFGMILRDSKYKGTADYDKVLELAKGLTRADEKEFIELVKKAKRLSIMNK